MACNERLCVFDGRRWNVARHFQVAVRNWVKFETEITFKTSPHTSADV